MEDSDKIAPKFTYDRADPFKLEIEVPVISFEPFFCFEVKDYEIVYKDD